MKNLYEPEKYKVWCGAGEYTGLCTVWNEPEMIYNRSKTLRENVAILGTLYSRQGVNVILRNLAQNPSIRKLYVWGNGPLSNTPFGVAGRSVLELLWKNGTEEDGTVKGSSFAIEKEIDPNVLRTIRENVELIDVSDRQFSEVEKLVAEEPRAREPYMKPVTFPDPVKEKPEVFPSEEVGWLVRDRTIAGAWSRVVERIMRYGATKGTQYGYQQRELLGVSWVVTKEDPTRPDFRVLEELPAELRTVIGATEDSIREYHAVFLSAEAVPGTAYTYGNRLMAYPNKNEPIDQIRDVIVRQLSNSPDSRRAVATTLAPPIDWDSREPPCITQVQALQSGGRLHFFATVRSHDIFKAAIPNAFGLRTLQKKIADDLGFELGELAITSQSAHIYEQDWEDARRLASCMFWEREPSLSFDPEAHADPRGNMVISATDRITVSFQSYEGEPLLELSGTTAKELATKIAHLELLSRSDHLMDIAMELQKAELALMKNVPYHQDRPFIA